MKKTQGMLFAAAIVLLVPSLAAAQVESVAAATPFSAAPGQPASTVALLGEAVAQPVPPVPPLVEQQSARRRAGVVRPLLRTVAMVGASLGGYALADANLDPGTSDVRYGPIAAGAAASALTGIVLSSGNPVRIVLGSALATLPSAALSTFVDGSLEAQDRGDIPLISFGVTHGLLASAFAQDR